MSTKVLAVIQGIEILLHPDGHISFLADADIDCDGSGGNPDHDPYFQPDTTLHHADGTALNAYTERFIVVPPAIVKGVPGIVMGCQAQVHYRASGSDCSAVVGDLGPSKKIGELSVACARKLHMPSNPNVGGEDDMRLVLYSLWPGVPAIVDDFTYRLQPS